MSAPDKAKAVRGKKAPAKKRTAGKEATSKKANPSYRSGDTQRARKRAEGIIDPSLSIITGDPLRVQIVAIATQRPISPSEFAREAGIALNVASYHFKVLREHEFLEIVEKVPVRGSRKHMHVATKKGFISDSDWGQVEQALRPGVAGAILQDFIGRVSQAIVTGTLIERDDACLYWTPRCLDEIAWAEQVEIIAWCIEESERLEDDTIKRRANGKSKDGFPATFAIAGFPSPTPSQIKRAKGKTKAKRKRPKAKGKDS
ncbi:MAG: helix-turn-helix domain-containing protein [Terrimicrobiaceae bacterium]